MKSLSRTFASVSVAALLLSQFLPAIAVAENEKKQKDNEIPGEYIVVLNNDTEPEDVETAHGVEAKVRVKNALKAFSATLSDAQLADLKQDERVRSVEPDRIVEIAAQTLPTGINRAEADLSPTAQINGVDERVDADIAIIDTGIQANHPDVNVVGGYNCTSRKTNSWADDNGHGTHVAGIAAAKDNTVGVVGMAPGARLWGVKVLNRQGSGNLSWIICGIDWVTKNAATIDVANMSLGGYFVSPALDQALANSAAAGVVYAVAAGNDSSDAATFSPANNPDVLAVSAIADFNGLPGGGAPATCRTDVDDTFADFSNFGAVVDIAAPGVCILSAWKGGGYATISGTSMASPHVAGAAALYIASHGKPTDAIGVAAVRSAIIAAGTAQSATDGFSGDPDTFSEPLLNAQSF